MKKVLFIAMVFYCCNCFSQEQEIKAVIDRMFQGMYNADTAALRKCFLPAGQLMTYSYDSKGHPRAKADSMDEFLGSVATMGPEDIEEKLTSWHILVDEGIAIVWAPYKFYFEGVFSHCGVNSFQLIQVQNQWKISLLTDTRRKTDCVDEDLTIRHLDSLMNDWHHAAAVADEDKFFGAMTPEALYIGTDPTERWHRDELREWAKKFFDRDAAWDFTPLSRSFEIDDSGKTAWMDELLDTWMGTCRSTGILKKGDNGWKIVYYHLSIAVPNDQLDEYRKFIGKE
ncbi:MAG: nuclear transport factor 2 family protein [Bacteroidota bacterium]|nr:nuclear transport factor 2 family protein [Bacteroidota bacterium]